MSKQSKSRTRFRRTQVRTPTGKTATHLVQRKPKQTICAMCGTTLAGLPREIPSKLKKVSRSRRTVSRKFGGSLCAKCVRRVEKYKARVEDGVEVRRDLLVEKFLPTGWYAKAAKAAKGSEKGEPKKAKPAKKAPAEDKKAEKAEEKAKA